MLEVCRKVGVMFGREVQNRDERLGRELERWRFSLVMAGDLARLRILTRMQGNPASRFLTKGRKVIWKDLRCSKKMEILMLNGLRSEEFS